MKMKQVTYTHFFGSYITGGLVRAAIIDHRLPYKYRLNVSLFIGILTVFQNKGRVELLSKRATSGIVTVLQSVVTRKTPFRKPKIRQGIVTQSVIPKLH